MFLSFQQIHNLSFNKIALRSRSVNIRRYRSNNSSFFESPSTYKTRDLPIVDRHRNDTPLIAPLSIIIAIIQDNFRVTLRSRSDHPFPLIISGPFSGTTSPFEEEGRKALTPPLPAICWSLRHFRRTSGSPVPPARPAHVFPLGPRSARHPDRLQKCVPRRGRP